MQFLRTFGTFLFVLLVIVVGGVFLGRSGLLLLSRINLEADINTLKAYAQNSGKYQQQCTTVFPLAQQTRSLQGFQVRFMDDHIYQVEAVCSFDTTQPILIKKSSLFPFTHKLPGSSGIFIPIDVSPTASEITIESFGGKTTFSVGTGDKVYPVAMCAGWEYLCCDPNTEISYGNMAGNVIDCPGKCAVQCKKRPLIYAFNANPSFDALQRLVEVSNDTSVQFSYTVGDPDGSVAKVQLDFGDGTVVSNGLEKENLVEHTYTCRQSVCSYTAILSLTDNEGNPSPTTSGTSTIHIRVTGQ